LSERGTEISEIRERITKLEVRFDELNKRLDNVANYTRELYKYLQQSSGR
jgi:prefoldin subunit 5